nr:hypothetical protein [Tanacetum cinerariifolium]GEY43315.1 hypothetical protein [Tanacetum cinerariifolium]GEY46751.1 hypothetical protein [Tanacetum cinerariifolium]
MTTKDVKSLARKYNVPLDLQHCVLTEGWIVDKLPEDAIGLYEQFFEFSGLRVPFLTFLLGWKDRFFFIDRRAIPDAMAWRHHDSDVYDAFSDNDFSIQDVKTLIERIIDLRPVPSGLLFGSRLATTWIFLASFLFSMIPEGMWSLCLNISVSLSFLALPSCKEPRSLPIIWEKKKPQAARDVAKKKESRNRGNDEGGSSKTTLANVENTDRESNASDGENRSASNSPCGSVSESVYNFVNGRNIKEGESSHGASLYVPRWVILQRCRVDTLEWCREIMFSQRGHGQTNILERFENLLANCDTLVETHAECSKTIQKLVIARQDLEHNAKFYTDAINHFRDLKEEHAAVERK